MRVIIIEQEGKTFSLSLSPKMQAQADDENLAYARRLYPTSSNIYFGTTAELRQTISPEAIRKAYEQAAKIYVDKILEGKSDSILREAVYLQNLAINPDVNLTDDQKATAATFQELNLWETAVVERREVLIASASLDGLTAPSWPAPPNGLAEFLKGF